jgi:hypothetical protein
MKKSHEQGSRQAFPGHITNRQGDGSLASKEHVIIIASDPPGGHTLRGKLKPAAAKASSGQQVLLYSPGHR